MKPVTETNIDAIVQQGSILILDVTRVAINFVHEIVCCNPKHISTKKGKSLPSEIWLQILSWAEFDSNQHVYKPVHPFSIQDSEAGPVLLCKALESWSPCGEIEEGDHFSAYQDYLQCPHKMHDDHNRPFQLPECQDGATLIPVKSLKLDKKFLFHNVDVADMIAWVEDGACSLCDGAREFCAGCRCAREMLGEFIYLPRRVISGIRVLCPLCIGIHYAETSLEVQSFEHGWAQDEELAKREEEYYAWVKKRMKQLGYL